MALGNKPPPAGRRGAEREDVTLAGSALAMTRSRSVIICDLSSDGAGLHARDLPLPGEELLFVAGSTERMADVAWRAKDRCGIRFDPPLESNEIARMKREAQWETVAGWWR